MAAHSTSPGLSRRSRSGSPEDNFLSRFPFKGGVAPEADWNGRVLWEIRHADQYHDGILLRNGNVLMDCLAQVPDEIAQRVKGGIEKVNMLSGQYHARPKNEAGKMYSTYLAEVTPAGETVWVWRTWEHLDPVVDGISEVQTPRTYPCCHSLAELDFAPLSAVATNTEHKSQERRR